uniref:hypothetical protein n=1 Tax=Umezakia ovalisporum TaxID=75695 RepID=UPI0028CB60C5|nr:hypothetical protein [Umezakia ovalisporum]
MSPGPTKTPTQHPFATTPTRTAIKPPTFSIKADPGMPAANILPSTSRISPAVTTICETASCPSRITPQPQLTTQKKQKTDP